MSPEIWVDYQLIKTKVSMKDVLARYGLLDQLAEKNARLSGPCPIHKGDNRSGFSVSLKKNLFRCFSPKCKAAGSVVDLVAALEKIELREAGRRLQEWFGLTPSRDPAQVGRFREVVLQKERPHGR